MFKRASLVLAGVLLATGCASGLKVRAIKPAKVNLGAANQLVVVQLEGRRSAKEQLLQELQAQARSTGYFTTADRSENGISMKAAGRNVNVTGVEGGPKPEEVWVRLDVLEWDAESDSRMEPVKDSKGNVTGEREVKFYRGEVLLAVTAANSAGRAVLAETEYESKVEAPEQDDALNQAARQAVARVLMDVTPTWESKVVKLDEDDKAQEMILKTAKDGNLNAAVTQMKQYLEQNPQNPAAQYNLAVFLDAQGQYQSAMDLYNQALSSSTKDFYAQSKAECAKRLADQVAMQE